MIIGIGIGLKNISISVSAWSIKISVKPTSDRYCHGSVGRIQKLFRKLLDGARITIGAITIVGQSSGGDPPVVYIDRANSQQYLFLIFFIFLFLFFSKLKYSFNIKTIEMLV